jgi:DNA polymerase III subunit delta
MLGGVASELAPAYLLTGTDRPKIRTALQRLRGRFTPESVELLTAGDASGEDAVAACNALGLFGSGERLVLVEHVEAWKAADVTAVAAYLALPTPGTVLALVGEGLKADGPLGKAVKKAGTVLAFDTPKRKLHEWVADQFARRRAHADPAASRALVELVGDDPDALAGEIDKLVTWAAGETITEADVHALAAGRAETAAYAITDAWGRRDLAAALAAVESLFERSPHPRARELPRLAGMLASHVGRVRACQALAAEGVRPRDAAARLKVHPFVAEKAFGHARNFTVDELRSATVRLAELDHALKGGSRLAGDLELERALVEITAAPEHR